VFINMASLRVYVLPESYEVLNKTLDDIKYVVNPTYSKEDVKKLDKEVVIKWDLGKKKYIPGMIPFCVGEAAKEDAWLIRGRVCWSQQYQAE